MWKCRDRYIDRQSMSARERKQRQRGKEKQCESAEEHESERDEEPNASSYPQRSTAPKALSQLPVPVSLWTGLHPKHVCAYWHAQFRHFCCVSLRECVYVCLEASMCVCHRLKVGSEGVSQRWEDREAHWKACVVRWWWRRAAGAGRQAGGHAGTHAVMLERGLIDLLHGHCCCKNLTHLRQMDGECVRAGVRLVFVCVCVCQCALCVWVRGRGVLHGLRE